MFCLSVILQSFPLFILFKRLIMTNSRKLLHRSSINVNVNAQRSANSILSLKKFENNHKTIFETERNSLMYPIKFYEKHHFLLTGKLYIQYNLNLVYTKFCLNM